MSSTVDWSSVRTAFPGVEGCAYLNTAAYGLPPPEAVAKVLDAVESWSTGRGSWGEWEREGELARTEMAALMGAAAGELALVPAMSVAAGQVAERMPRAAGSNIVAGGGEFRSNLFPWLAQEERGHEVRVVPFESGRLDPRALTDAIDARTALVAVSSVQSSSGYRIDLGPVKARCAEVGARLFLDATQHLGQLQLDLEGVDYLATAAYKWLLCPRGVAFLWARDGLGAEMTPAFASWKAPADPYAEYYGPPLELAPDASRHDVSLPWTVWAGAPAALRFVRALGIEAIEERVLDLARRFRAGLPALGLAPLFVEAETCGIVSLAVPDADAVRVRLEEREVFAAVRGPYLRVSMHFYNDETDVDRALDALRG